MTSNAHPRNAGPLADLQAWDPAATTWLPGVDYLTTWRDAKDAADALNTLFMEHDLPADTARAIAVSLADGGASVDLRVSEYGARVLAATLARVRGQS